MTRQNSEKHKDIVEVVTVIYLVITNLHIFCKEITFRNDLMSKGFHLVKKHQEINE